MHELGILIQIAKSVHKIMLKNGIKTIRHITLEVGELSGVVPAYLQKLLPAAADLYPFLKNAELKILMTQGRGLIIKDIGY